MDDIDYTLRHSPNHHIALQQLAQYVLAGGRPYDFPAPDCFFAWAHGFAPDDAVVLQINGNFAWKRGDLQRAGELYQQALEIDPNSAELHYNLGLYYFAGANYEKALEHAWQAYGKGYPLPGLRRKLEQAGHWRNPDPSLGATSPN
jgi:tetratricopeptide (TPR) repeat protein